MISSAGWNTSRTRAGSRSPRSARARPAPSSADVCTSCPQACATPATVLRHGSLVRSSTGSASRSARRTTTGPVSGPISATSPVRWSGRVTMPASASRLATTPVVRSSAHDSSGLACRSRRTSTISASSRVSASSSAGLSVPSGEPATRDNLTAGVRGVWVVLGTWWAGRGFSHLSPQMRPLIRGRLLCRGPRKRRQMQRSRRPGDPRPALTPRRTPRGSGRRQASPGGHRRGQRPGSPRGPP